MLRSGRSSLAAVLVLCGGAAGAAQPAPLRTAESPARAVLRGRVLDAAGAPIASARITATADASPRRVPAAALADREGRFLLDLEPSAYGLRLTFEGFTELEERVVLAPGQTLTRDFVLKIADVRESVTVTAPRGYAAPPFRSATKTDTPLRDVPQSVTVVTSQLMQDQLMTSVGDVVRYVPGVSLHQGENNRDQVIMRGNSSSADFFVDGVRDDVQYYRDLYNLDRVEALKGPNAMIFGRGGAGGVINRVTKEAGFDAFREVSLQAGSFSNKRATADVGQPLSRSLAVRLNGLYEDSGSFRDGVSLERYGVAPTLTFQPGDATKLTLGYEVFHDSRTADRGISSYGGRPAGVDVSTFYGDPDQSHVRADVKLASAALEHRIGELTIRNRTLYGDYDRGYQNFVPGAVSADRSRVLLTAYNNATQRTNLFNQTDLNLALKTGPVRHTLLAGFELGRQRSENLRNTGFFGGTATSLSVPYDSPTIDAAITFRQSATDADNRVRANVAAVYAQDQMELSPALQVVAGIRFDRFSLAYHNNRDGLDLSRTDNLLSPRVGVVVKPLSDVSLYGSYSVTYLPSSGDQFSSLTNVTQQLEPEAFDNYELGARWEPAGGLSLSLAAYRLDRTNTRSTDPNDPTRIVQTGSQRTSGVELGLNGQITTAWSIAGGYSYQDARVTSATAAAHEGARVAQVPRHMASLWNQYRIRSRLGAALGIVYRSAVFAAIDNTVTLPGYTRVDAALFLDLTAGVRVQLNLENVLDRTYYANADNNTNITPGSPRAARVAATLRF